MKTFEMRINSKTGEKLNNFRKKSVVSLEFSFIFISVRLLYYLANIYSKLIVLKMKK